MSRKPIIFERDVRMARRQQRLGRLMRLGVLLLVAIAIALASLYFYHRLAAEEQAARNRLRTFAELRASALHRFLRAHEQETALWASQRSMRQLARRYIGQWQAMTPQERASVRQMLSPARQGKAASRAESALNTLRTDAINAFLALHRQTLSGMQAFLEHHGYANIHFLTPEGDLVFSARPRADFGQNLAINGSLYAGRALGQAFQRALRLISPGQVVFEDFQPYPQPDSPPRAFFAAPLLELEGEKVGVMAIELDTAPIDRILDANGALGPDALIYAVGPDMRLRNNLPGRPEPTALRLRMDSPAIRKALDGEQAIGTWKNDKGQRRIAIASPMNFSTVRWAVITEMPLDDMRKPYAPYKLLWGLAIALILLLGAVQYWLVRRG